MRCVGPVAAARPDPAAQHLATSLPAVREPRERQDRIGGLPANSDVGLGSRRLASPNVYYGVSSRLAGRLWPEPGSLTWITRAAASCVYSGATEESRGRFPHRNRPASAPCLRHQQQVFPALIVSCFAQLLRVYPIETVCLRNDFP